MVHTDTNHGILGCRCTIKYIIHLHWYSTLLSNYSSLAALMAICTLALSISIAQKFMLETAARVHI